MNGIGFLENIWQDVLYALRTMRKNPAFALTEATSGCFRLTVVI